MVTSEELQRSSNRRANRSFQDHLASICASTAVAMTADGPPNCTAPSSFLVGLSSLDSACIVPYGRAPTCYRRAESQLSFSAQQHPQLLRTFMALCKNRAWSVRLQAREPRYERTTEPVQTMGCGLALGPGKRHCRSGRCATESRAVTILSRVAIEHPGGERLDDA